MFAGLLRPMGFGIVWYGFVMKFCDATRLGGRGGDCVMCWDGEDKSRLVSINWTLAVPRGEKDKKGEMGEMGSRMSCGQDSR